MIQRLENVLMQQQGEDLTHVSKERGEKMKRTGNLKRRESKNLPPEKLHEILSKIYPDRVVDEIFPKLIKCETIEKGSGEK